VEIRYALVRRFTRGGGGGGGGSGKRGGSDARDLPSSQIVSNRCLYSSAGVGALVPCSFLSANVIVIVGADRPDAKLPDGVIIRRSGDCRPLDRVQWRSSRGVILRTRELFRDRGAALAAMMGVSGE